MTDYTKYSIPQLIIEINKWDKKLEKIKTPGGLWVCEFAIKTIRAELDKRVKNPNKVTKMIVEART